MAPWTQEAALQQRRGALACNCRTHPPITFPPPKATRQDRAGLGFINRQLRQPLDNSPGDESPSAGVRKPGQWSEGFLWLFTLSLPVVAPQTWTCTETDAKRPEETKRFVFCRRVPQPVLINNHYRLPSPQSVDDMNVGPKGRSGGAPPHPQAPCHTLEEWALDPPGDQAGRLLLG